MTTKHTPGPWRAHIQRSKEGQDLGWIVAHGNGRIGWASLAYADTNEEAAHDDPAREANARLIAAAPDLLTALETMVKRIEFYSSMGESAQPNIEQWEYTEGSTDMANARVAIAKAKGTV